MCIQAAGNISTLDNGFPPLQRGRVQGKWLGTSLFLRGLLNFPRNSGSARGRKYLGSFVFSWIKWRPSFCILFILSQIVLHTQKMCERELFRMKREYSIYVKFKWVVVLFLALFVGKVFTYEIVNCILFRRTIQALEKILVFPFPSISKWNYFREFVW